LSNQGSTASYKQSEMLYEQALAIEPDYAAAWTGLSVNYFRLVGAGLLPADKGYVLAREVVNRAMTLDPGYAPAYAQSGWLAMYQDNDLAAALMFNLGRLDEAIASYRTVLRLSPGFYGAQAGMGAALLLQGKDQAALDAMRQETVEVERLPGLAMVYHALGDRAESDRALAEFIAVHGRTWPASVAYVMAYRGEVDRAFEWLRKALQYKDPGLPELVFLPYFDNIRGDPRWLPFLRRIGRAPEQLAAIRFDVKLSKAGGEGAQE